MFPVTFPGERPMGEPRLSLPLRQVLGQMKLNLLRVDASGVIVEVHDGFCQMTGYVEGELLGREAVTLLWDPADEAIIQQKGQERCLGVVSTYEVSIRGKDGRRIWVYVGGYPVVDPDGRFEGSIGLHLDITNQKEQEQRMSYLNANLESEVQKKVGEILELYRRMEGLQERERRHVAAELHDDIGHSLLLQKMEVERLKDAVQDLLKKDMEGPAPEILQMVERLAEGSGNVIKKLRQVSHSIFPPELHFGTLVDAMEAKMGYLFSYHGIKFDILVPGSFQDPSPEIKLLLYRCFQEAVNNAIKHAKAHRIGIVMKRSSGEIEMEVWNDCNSGAGLPTCSGSGLGRLSIQERLLPWQGRLETSTQQDGSFIMRIILPEGNHA